jgi:hypothetical protein
VPAPGRGSYCLVDADRELRQGEIISNLTYYEIVEAEEGAGKINVNLRGLSYAVIATPDCDLLQDFITRRGGTGSSLFSVLLYGMEEASSARSRIGYGRSEWKHVVQNEMDRFYFLEAVSAEHDSLGAGIPDSVVDFKRYFTLPPGEIYRQLQLPDLERVCRRCRFQDLWREDFQRRAMSYMQRVGLPDPLDAR